MKNMRWLVLILGFTLSCNGQQEKTVDAKQAIAMIEKEEVVVIDVRTPEEYAEGHLPGATNINYYDQDFAIQLGEMDENQKYLVYCHSGARSAKAAHLMKEQGFSGVYNLEGGISGWKLADGKVEE